MRFSRIQFVCAVAVAGAAKVWDVMAESERAVKDIWRSLRAKPRERVSDEIYLRRMTVCKNCPVYFPLTNSCGSRLRRGEAGKTGCGCFLGLLAQDKATRCWLRDHAETQPGEGWPDELMDSDS